MCVYIDLMDLNLHPATCKITAEWMETFSTSNHRIETDKLVVFIVACHGYCSRLYVWHELVWYW